MGGGGGGENVFECGGRNKFLVGLRACFPRNILDLRKPTFFKTSTNKIVDNVQYSDFNLYKQPLIVCVKIPYLCAQ